MRSLMERSTWQPVRSPRGTHLTSLLSLLGVGCPPVATAVSKMENSCRASPLLVYKITCFGSV